MFFNNKEHRGDNPSNRHIKKVLGQLGTGILQEKEENNCQAAFEIGQEKGFAEEADRRVKQYSQIKETITAEIPHSGPLAILRGVPDRESRTSLLLDVKLRASGRQFGVHATHRVQTENPIAGIDPRRWRLLRIISRGKSALLQASNGRIPGRVGGGGRRREKAPGMIWKPGPVSGGRAERA